DVHGIDGGPSIDEAAIPETQQIVVRTYQERVLDPCLPEMSRHVHNRVASLGPSLVKPGNVGEVAEGWARSFIETTAKKLLEVDIVERPGDGAMHIPRGIN